MTVLKNPQMINIHSRNDDLMLIVYSFPLRRCQTMFVSVFVLICPCLLTWLLKSRVDRSLVSCFYMNGYTKYLNTSFKLYYIYICYEQNVRWCDVHLAWQPQTSDLALTRCWLYPWATAATHFTATTSNTTLVKAAGIGAILMMTRVALCESWQST